jgi:hypothetical protein
MVGIKQAREKSGAQLQISRATGKEYPRVAGREGEALWSFAETNGQLLGSDSLRGLM